MTWYHLSTGAEPGHSHRPLVMRETKVGNSNVPTPHEKIQNTVMANIADLTWSNVRTGWPRHLKESLVASRESFETHPRNLEHAAPVDHPCQLKSKAHRKAS